MQNFDRHNFSSPLIDPGSTSTELSLLREVLRMLPAGVTVQDEHGRLVLVNDAAAAQLAEAADGQEGTAPSPLDRRRETGRVVLRDGRPVVTLPRTVQISRSSGYPRLDEAGAAAAKKARFKPYTENGMPLEFWVVMPLVFDLEN